MFIRAGLLRSRQLWNSFGDTGGSCESEYKGMMSYMISPSSNCMTLNSVLCAKAVVPC